MCVQLTDDIVIRFKSRDGAKSLPQWCDSVIDYTLQKLLFLRLCGVEDDTEQLVAIVSGLRAAEAAKYCGHPIPTVSEFLKQFAIPLGWTDKPEELIIETSIVTVLSTVALLHVLRQRQVTVEAKMPEELASLIRMRLPHCRKRRATRV